MQNSFSFYSSHFEKKTSNVMTIADFINSVKYGTWQKLCEPVALEKDKAKRKALKDKLPAATLSGVFTERNKAGLETHSGYIAMDFDNLQDLALAFEQLSKDPYSYATFRSVSGAGICVLVQIDGARHLDAFLALEQYYLSTYGLIVDTACKNVDRLRYVSSDPLLESNTKAKKFANYLPKKALKKVPEVVYSDSDIKHILDQVQSKGIDLTHSSYDRYLRLAFALQSEYGETGRAYFHTLCQNSEKYNYENCDKQFNYCLRHTGSGVTISTLFYYAKEAGLETLTKKTIVAATVARQVKKSGRDEESAKKALAMDGLSGKNVDKVIAQIFEGRDIKAADGTTLVGQLKLFLQMNYQLRRNEVTGNLEHKSEVLDDIAVNSIYVAAKEAVSEKVAKHDLESLLNSDFVEMYNPILNFFDTYRSRKETGLIKQLAQTITTNTGFSPGNFDGGYVEHFLTKWLVGIVALAHGKVSPLLLALTGGQNKGKTEWFRRLLPDELKPYYAESKLDAGKDDYILMCQKLIIMDDELSGKSKKDEALLKELTSKQTFSVRLPYGRRPVELKRLAALCGTSNPTDLLSDPTGNRRIIPIEVVDLNHELYNSIDKISLLMEAYNLYNAGYNWHLNREDIERLNKCTIEFEQVSPEAELIQTHFIPQEPGSLLLSGAEYLTATQIKAELEKATNQRLSIRKLGLELRRLGFTQHSKKINKAPVYCYLVSRVNGTSPYDLETSKAPAENDNFSLD